MLNSQDAWHHITIAEAMLSLKTSIGNGLDASEVFLRRQSYGPNALTPKKGKGSLLIFLEQFNQPLIFILLAAALITGLLREWVDMTVILAVIIINAIVGFLQEAKAVKVMEALVQSMSTQAYVLRSGGKQQIPASELVPGDIVFLQSGDRVPADLRLFSSQNLQIDESVLTGESVPVEKNAQAELPITTPLVERVNLAQSSTLVTSGVGAGIVIATGDHTEIGHIKEMVDSAELLTTPLTQKLERFSVQLTIMILVIAVVTLIAAHLNGFSNKDAFLSVVALAVGAVPEGLPVVVTIALAIGVSRMARRNVIVRKLPVVETLGSTTVICSDKTGTLTENAMTVQDIMTADNHYRVSGIGYDPQGEITLNNIQINPSEKAALWECLRAGALCNDSRLVHNNETWGVEGDPTEGALIVSAIKGQCKDESLKSWSRLDSIPFESEQQYMATLHDNGRLRRVYLKGSIESLLPRCQTQLNQAGKELAVDRQGIQSWVDTLASKGLRVLAFAKVDVAATYDRIQDINLQSGLTFLGLQGMMDPPRQTAIAAVRSCHTAGMQVKMITGDHVSTALAIGRQIGLSDHTSEMLALTGPELEKLSDKALVQAAEQTSVFARVAPEQKLRLVKALQARGHVVAMTGDGVNDAPALRQADIGIAMGQTGTEVAKESADMVLLDDNFATIHAAIEEGRRIYDNIVKSIVWLLPTNASLGLIIIVTMFLRVGVPVTPLQILWINTIAAVLLGTMLAFEVAEPLVMERPPRSPRKPLLSKASAQWIILLGIVMCAIAFGVYHWGLRGLQTPMSHKVAQTMAVNTIVAGQIFLLLACRSLQHSMFKIGIFSNRLLWMGVGLMAFAQCLLTYLPIMNHLFETEPLALSQWGFILWGGGIIYFIFEGVKLASQREDLSKV